MKFYKRPVATKKFIKAMETLISQYTLFCKGNEGFGGCPLCEASVEVRKRRLFTSTKCDVCPWTVIAGRKCVGLSGERWFSREYGVTSDEIENSPYVQGIIVGMKDRVEELHEWRLAYIKYQNMSLFDKIFKFKVEK